MHKFAKVLERLRSHYGKLDRFPARGPFELVLWENSAYLLSDARRREVFEALRKQVGLNAAAIDAAPDAVLLPIAIRGGMRPEMRMFRWRQIAQITLNDFGGNLDVLLQWPYAEAKKSLKRFPAIGDPGAEKILLFCGAARGLPLESNGLRVVSRLGWGHAHRNYAASYRSVQDHLKPELPVHVEQLQEAHLLLRTHGKVICKENLPQCRICPLENLCRYADSSHASLAGSAG